MDFLPPPTGICKNGKKWYKMDCGDKEMSTTQNFFPTYCEAVCILSESERQILERKGKERKEEAFHWSESV